MRALQQEEIHDRIVGKVFRMRDDQGKPIEIVITEFDYVDIMYDITHTGGVSVLEDDFGRMLISYPTNPSAMIEVHSPPGRVAFLTLKAHIDRAAASPITSIVVLGKWYDTANDAYAYMVKVRKHPLVASRTIIYAFDGTAHKIQEEKTVTPVEDITACLQHFEGLHNTRFFTI